METLSLMHHMDKEGVACEFSGSCRDVSPANLTSMLVGCAKMHHYDEELCSLLANAAEAAMPAASGSQVGCSGCPGGCRTQASAASCDAQVVLVRHQGGLSGALHVLQTSTGLLCTYWWLTQGGSTTTSGTSWRCIAAQPYEYIEMLPGSSPREMHLQ